jgi:hypothetical protein
MKIIIDILRGLISIILIVLISIIVIFVTLIKKLLTSFKKNHKPKNDEKDTINTKSKR